MMLPLVLLHFRVGPSLCVILKHALCELESPWRILPPFEGEHLERAERSWLAPISPTSKRLGSHMGWLEKSSIPKYPHYDWVDHMW
jgi:hypothetical protein